MEEISPPIVHCMNFQVSKYSFEFNLRLLQPLNTYESVLLCNNGYSFLSTSIFPCCRCLARHICGFFLLFFPHSKSLCCNCAELLWEIVHNLVWSSVWTKSWSQWLVTLHFEGYPRSSVYPIPLTKFGSALCMVFIRHFPTAVHWDFITSPHSQIGHSRMWNWAPCIEGDASFCPVGEHIILFGLSDAMASKCNSYYI